MPVPAPESRTQVRPRALFPVAWSRSCNHLRAVVWLRVRHLATYFSLRSIDARLGIGCQLHWIHGGNLARRQALCTAWRLKSVEQLLSNRQVALSADGQIVIQEDWLSKARRLGQPDISWNRSREDLGSEVLLGVLRNLTAQVQSG